ncbi:MAG: hypothetical protein IMX01_01030 [Limnochordaceae bacterium]|nr:hypothetical protein [Limnochordaceae bacterium]
MRMGLTLPGVSRANRTAVEVGISRRRTNGLRVFEGVLSDPRLLAWRGSLGIQSTAVTPVTGTIRSLSTPYPLSLPTLTLS